MSNKKLRLDISEMLGFRLAPEVLEEISNKSESNLSIDAEMKVRAALFAKIGDKVGTKG